MGKRLDFCIDGIMRLMSKPHLMVKPIICKVFWR
jgi:hypothetical protein